jgi:hypothetical protein
MTLKEEKLAADGAWWAPIFAQKSGWHSSPRISYLNTSFSPLLVVFWDTSSSGSHGKPGNPSQKPKIWIIAQHRERAPWYYAKIVP